MTRIFPSAWSPQSSVESVKYHMARAKAPKAKSVDRVAQRHGIRAEFPPPGGGTWSEMAPQHKRVQVENKSEQVQDAEKDNSLIQRLDYDIWLPHAAKTYHISSRIEDFVIVGTPLCPSDIPNRNGHAFPISELVRYMPPPVAAQTYKAWKGCPMHLEHEADDCTTAYGVVLDTYLEKIRGYGNDKHWKVMALCAIDKAKYPEIAQEILDGTINTYSMGAMVDEFTCSYCHAPCWEDKNGKHHHCAHVGGIDQVNWNVIEDWQGNKHLAYLRAHGIQPAEFSIVRDPAWVVALSDNVMGQVTS